MIIILDSSISSLLSAESSHVLEAIENIAIARSEGNHLVTCEPEIASQILATRLSNRAQRVYYTIKNKSIQELAATVKSKAYIRVVSPDYFSVNRPNEIMVSITFFCSTSTIQPTKLLCEDSLDGKIIAALTKNYLAASKHRNPRLSFRYEHGGGSRITRVFREIECHEACLLLCLVDSDKKYHKDNISAKAKNLIRDRQKNTTHVEILPCHELENLIPTRHLLLLYESTHPDTAMAISSLNISPNTRYSLNYLDLKEGPAKHHRTSNPAEKKFWEGIFKAAQICLTQSASITGLGEQITTDYESLLEDDGLSFLDTDFRPIFEEIAKIVECWGHGCIPIMAN
ncbi:hypothetical protein [Chitinimonas prasina]|uniref:hypothetical protein n=1 Tax=Chitinimonas prasina TaxID=1434937 RepID=UPI0024E137CC|nr:hypothetical protein [Chitinimonas prasina]